MSFSLKNSFRENLKEIGKFLYSTKDTSFMGRERCGELNEGEAAWTKPVPATFRTTRVLGIPFAVKQIQ